MKRIAATFIIGAILLGFACAVLCFSCSRIETDRYAKLNYRDGIITLVVAGYHRALLTPEGPFPEWANGLRIILHPDRNIGNTGKHKFIAGEDFSTQGDKVKSGTILIDFDKGVIEANLDYTETYSFMRTNGQFPIRSGK